MTVLRLLMNRAPEIYYSEFDQTYSMSISVNYVDVLCFSTEYQIKHIMINVLFSISVDKIFTNAATT